MATATTPGHTLYVKNLNDRVKQNRLRESLYACFSQYGKVLEIISSKTRRMRGQAWIVFETIPGATAAYRKLQNEVFLDKELVIEYAKTKSDIIAKRDGTYRAREKRPREEKKQPSTAAEPKKKKVKTAASEKSMKPMSRNEPNKILFLEKLPESVTDEMLRILFSQYHGFHEVRMVASKQMAFVEFQDEVQAGIALQGLYGFKLTPNDVLHVNFAKK